MSARIGWLASGLASVAAGIGLVLAAAVDAGIVFIVLGAGLLAAGAAVPTGAPAANAPAPDAGLDRRVAELRQLEGRLLAGGISPSERAYHELRPGSGDGPRAPAGPDELDDDERVALAQIIGKLTRRYDALFEPPFPYSMGWYQRPRDGDTRAGSRLHAVYLPPLVRSATVRKFLVGYEMTSEPQRDFTAEDACERLKVCPT